MKNSTVLEVVIFEANPKFTEVEVKSAINLLNDIVKSYDGFIKRITANNDQMKYIDLVYWTDMKSAKNAAKSIMENEKAATSFKVIKPDSVAMHHFQTFNQLEK